MEVNREIQVSNDILVGFDLPNGFGFYKNMRRNKKGFLYKCEHSLFFICQEEGIIGLFKRLSFSLST